MNGLKQTIVVQSKNDIQLIGNTLLFSGKEKKEVHLTNIDTLILSSKVSNVISTVTIRKILENDILILILDEKENPLSQIVPLYSNGLSSSSINMQLKWTTKSKEKLTELILKNKIKNQQSVLTKYKNDKESLTPYLSSVKGMDKANKEGQAAKVYFHILFSSEFNRGDEENNINHYLNYGYAILASYITRAIVAKGYLTQLGIHHNSKSNQFNLTYDFIEPFRPFVDEYVYSLNINEELSFDNKLKIINILNNVITYSGKKYILKDAISDYVTSCINYLNNKGQYKDVSIK